MPNKASTTALGLIRISGDQAPCRDPRGPHQTPKRTKNHPNCQFTSSKVLRSQLQVVAVQNLTYNPSTTPSGLIYVPGSLFPNCDPWGPLRPQRGWKTSPKLTVCPSRVSRRRRQNFKPIAQRQYEVSSSHAVLLSCCKVSEGSGAVFSIRVKAL